MGDEGVTEADLFEDTPDPPDAGLVAELLATTGLALLVAMVRKGHGDEGDAPAFDRLQLVDLLDKAPNLCVQARNAVRNSQVYAAVMFYERTRLYGAALGGNRTRCFMGR